jgi:hypothetical protein
MQPLIAFWESVSGGFAAITNSFLQATPTIIILLGLWADSIRRDRARRAAAEEAAKKKKDEDEIAAKKKKEEEDNAAMKKKNEEEAAARKKKEDDAANAGMIATAVIKTADEAAALRAEVKTTLADHMSMTTTKLDSIAKTGEEAAKLGRETHLLCNSQLGVVKLNLAVAIRAKYTLTKDPKDLEMAEAAEKDYIRHQENQTKLDEQRAQSAPSNQKTD